MGQHSRDRLNNQALEAEITGLKAQIGLKMLEWTGVRVNAPHQPVLTIRTLDCVRRVMVDATGIEPVTPSMSTKCSPAELRIRSVRRQGLYKGI